MQSTKGCPKAQKEAAAKKELTIFMEGDNYKNAPLFAGHFISKFYLNIVIGTGFSNKYL